MAGLPLGNKTDKRCWKYLASYKGLNFFTYNSLIKPMTVDRYGLPPGAQWEKNLPAMQKIQVRSLGWDDHLEKEMTTNSSTPAWEIPEEPSRQSMGSQESDMT